VSEASSQTPVFTNAWPDAAHLLGFRSKQRLYRAIKRGDIPATRINGRYIIALAWIAARAGLNEAKQ
jgi:hypothetical protein